MSSITAAPPPTLSVKGKKMLEVARALVTAKNFSAAEGHLRKPDVEKETGVEGLLLLASILDDLGKKDAANAAFASAEEQLEAAGEALEPRHLLKWGMLLYLQNKFDEAAQKLEESAKVGPPLPPTAQEALDDARRRRSAAAPPLGGGGGGGGKKKKKKAPPPPPPPPGPPLPDLATPPAMPTCPCRAAKCVCARYTEDIRWQRFDVGKMLLQRTLFSSLLAGSEQDFYLVPRAWWDTWRAHVGGFSDADAAAWNVACQRMGFDPANPAATVETLSQATPDTPSVRDAFSEFNLLSALPGAAKADCTTAAAFAGAPPPPGPLRSDELADGPSLGCPHGPRLKRTLTLEEVFEMPSAVWSCMEFWYGHEGPRVRRFSKPGERAAGGAQSAWFPEDGPDGTEATGGASQPAVEAATGGGGGGGGSGGGGGGGGSALVEVEDEDAEGGGKPAPQLSPSSRGTYCRLCGGIQPNSMLRLCSWCEKVKYCDKVCQLLDWQNGHKEECTALKKKKETMPPAEYTAVEPCAPRRSMLVGLENIGNTCFMAASLQMLASVWPLTVYYLRKEYEQDLQRDNPLGTKGIMSEEYAEMVKALILTSKKSVAPTALMKQVRLFQSRFEGFQQHDAHELVMYLMDGLHEDCNRGSALKPKPQLRDMLPGESDLAWGKVCWEWYTTVNQSRIVDLFYGQFRSAITCPEPACGYRSVRYDPFNVINLPMPGTGTRTVDVMLRRSAPGLLAPEAFQLPLAGAPEDVLRAWDAIAEFAGPNELYELRVPRALPFVTAASLLQRLSEMADLDPARLVLTKEGRVLSPDTQLSMQEEPGPPLIANEVAIAEWLLPGAPAPPPEADAKLSDLVDIIQGLCEGTGSAATAAGGGGGGGSGGGGSVASVPVIIDAPANPPSPGWTAVVTKPPKKKGKGGAGGGGGGGGGDAAAAAPAPPLTGASAELAEVAKTLLACTPPARRQLVLLDLWTRTDSAMKDTVVHVGPGHGWEPGKAFAQDSPKNILTLAVSLPAGASLALLRLHAAAALLPVFGGLPAMRKVLASKEAQNHKAHFDTQGAKIPGHAVLLEVAARLPLCSPAALAKGSKLTWAPSLAVVGPSGAFTECGEGVAAGVPMASQFPLELCGSRDGVALDGASGAAVALAALRVSVALRGNLFHGTLKRDALMERFPVSIVSKAQREEDATAKNIYSCFFQHQQEVVEEGNYFRCAGCENSVPVRQKFDVWRLPKYLVLNLKRYGTRLTKKGLHMQKSEERVDFPLVGLDLSPFNLATQAEFGDGPQTTALSTYDCVAVVQQHGQMKGGHYTAYINVTARMKGCTGEPGEWYHFNDKSFTRVALKPNNEPVVNADAYVMLYGLRETGR